MNGTTVEGFAKLDESLHGQNSFNLNLMGLVRDDNTYAGQEVVITYTALVNKANLVENNATSTQDPDGTTKKHIQVMQQLQNMKLKQQMY